MEGNGTHMLSCKQTRSVLSSGLGPGLMPGQHTSPSLLLLLLFMPSFLLPLNLPGPEPSRCLTQPHLRSTGAPGRRWGHTSPHERVNSDATTSRGGGSYLPLRSLRPAGPRGGPRDQPRMPRRGPRQAPCLAATCNLRPPPWRPPPPVPHAEASSRASDGTASAETTEEP